MSSKILISCASSIATSTVIAMEVQELAETSGLDISISQCSFSELDSKIEISRPDLILVSGPVKKYGDIPVLVATPFLTGVGKEVLAEKIVETLKSAGK
jgi:PTS system galactitol-specific IIB component